MGGIGYRVHSAEGLYVNFGYAPNPKERSLWFVKLSAGEDFLQVNIGVGFYWP